MPATETTSGEETPKSRKREPITVDCSDEETRARLVAFIDVCRAMLPVRPDTNMRELLANMHVDTRLPPFLITLGYLRRDTPDGAVPARYTWLAKDVPTATIVDAVIVHRRRLDAATRAKAAGNALSPDQLELVRQAIAVGQKFEQQCEQINTQLATCAREMAELRARKTTSDLSTDDRELVNMVINDHAQLAAQVAGMREDLSMLTRQVFKDALTRNQLPDTTRPAVIEAHASGRKWKIGILGPYEREYRFVEEHVRAALNGSARLVELSFVDLNVETLRIPSNLDALIVTDNALPRFKNVGTPVTAPVYRLTTHGFKTIAEQVRTIVTGAKAA